MLAGCATFIVINADGWVLTAAHVASNSIVWQAHQQEMAEYEKKCAEIRADVRLSGKQKADKIHRLNRNPEWITDVLYWWAGNNVTAGNFVVDQRADLLVTKLSGLDLTEIHEYPKFANPQGDLHPGTSLCRLGFPFNQVTATFDVAAKRFAINMPELGMFPNDGIYTRLLTPTGVGDSRIRYLETSSPGLMGQSGGPIFDTRGHIWAIQSLNQSLPLGLPGIKNQFLHMGAGCHVEYIDWFLNQHNVAHEIA